MEAVYDLEDGALSGVQTRASEPPVARRPDLTSREKSSSGYIDAHFAYVVKIAIHLLLVPLAFALAFAVRFDFDIPDRYWSTLASALPILLASRFVVFGLLRVYRGWWRYVSVADLASLLRATTISTLIAAIALHLSGHLAGMPRSILPLDWAFTLLLVGGARLSVRVFLQERALWPLAGLRDRTPVLIIGAGNAAERLVRELRRHSDAPYVPVALVDDDHAVQGMSLHGVRVKGVTDQIPSIVKTSGAQLAIIALTAATREQMQRIVKLCKEAGIKCQIIPSLPELLNGSARLNQLRDVQIEDLLGRAAVELDLSPAQQAIAGKVVLITGGAGSIGSELARQVAAMGPRQLVLVEQAESPLYFVDLELRARWPNLDIVPVIADICDEQRMKSVFAEYRPNIVLHAAAYKHVPLMEHNVAEAVRNNVLGTLRVAECAAQHEAEKFVLISTDKAVRPSSVMGATKRIAERIVLGWPSLVEAKTDFRAVRFGNVLGSAGSVIPLFKAQLAKGGPLTVTHPDVTRYFMTIPEAARLVLLAATLPAAAGRISMLEMGEAVKIKDLAENLIRLSGLEPGVDVELQYTDLRAGEKLYEELMSSVEATVPTPIDKIRVVQTDESDPEAISVGVAQLIAATAAVQGGVLLPSIIDLVPDCVEPLRSHGPTASGGPNATRDWHDFPLATLQNCDVTCSVQLDSERANVLCVAKPATRRRP